jgi:acetyltransferase-like isoleucine patch superfamily enzyme
MNIRGIIQRYRTYNLQKRGVKINNSSRVGPLVSIGQDHLAKVHGILEIGDFCNLNQGVEVNPFGGSIVVAENVWIGPYVIIYGHGGVVIGKNTLISMHCTVLSSNHVIPPLGKNIRDHADELRPTSIGSDVWIGANAVILGGVTLANSSIVAAGAVVTNDVPEGSIVAGVPAREINRRHSSLILSNDE